MTNPNLTENEFTADLGLDRLTVQQMHWPGWSHTVF
jgi:hypothetical protein